MLNHVTHSDNNYIQVKPKKIALSLGLFLLLLVILSLIGQYLHFYTYYDEAFGLIPLVNIARNLSIPTIFEVLLLFFTAVLLGVVAAIQQTKKDVFYRHWAALAYMFVFLSLNEGTGLYKLVFIPLRNAIRDAIPGCSIRSWQMTLSLIVIALLVFYRGFFRSLPAGTKKMIIISAVLYMTGFTMGKLISSIYVDLYTKNNYMYAVLVTIARMFEISSVIAFIYTLLDYYEANFPNISLKIRKPR